MQSDGEAKWSEVEQAFFDTAPPDEPAAAPAPLDDSPLDASPPVSGSPARDRLARLRVQSVAALLAARASLHPLLGKLRAAPWLATLTTPRLDRRAITIALAVMLTGLSAGVVASRSSASANTPVAAAVPTAASADAPPASEVIPARASGTPRPHTRVAKHPHVRASAAKKTHHKQRKAASGHLAR